MKIYKIATLCMLALPALMLTSCSDDDDPIEVTVRLNQTALPYDADGVWQGVNTNNTFQSQGIVFSHEGETGPWGLVWNGFTPARVSDTSVQTDWFSHQFQIMTGGGMSGQGTPYIVGFWNTQENETTPLSARSCRLWYQDQDGNISTFAPKSVYVQNTAYTYYTMQDGNSFCKVFGPSDYLSLTAHGVHADGTESTVSKYLAQGDNMLCEWTLFDLTPLGTVTDIYFTMEGSDTGQWGLNTPSYFALDCLTVRYTL